MNNAGHKNKEILIKEIAELLAVDEWFDKEEFSNTTGVSLKSCSVRLKIISDKGYLERKGGRLSLKWRMTRRMKALMIEAGNDNKYKRGKPAIKKIKAVVIDIVADEILAHHEHGNRMLKSVWMV